MQEACSPAGTAYVLVNEVRGRRIRDRKQRIVCLETGLQGTGEDEARQGILGLVWVARL